MSEYIKNHPDEKLKGIRISMRGYVDQDWMENIPLYAISKYMSDIKKKQSMSKYNIIAESSEYTVVSEYEHNVSSSDAYQSEADLEKEFIHPLQEQGYEYLSICSEADLVSNLRKQLEKLNSYTFTDNEWEHFFNENLAK